MTTEKIRNLLQEGLELGSLGYANEHIWKHWQVETDRIGKKRVTCFTTKGESDTEKFNVIKNALLGSTYIQKRIAKFVTSDMEADYDPIIDMRFLEIEDADEADPVGYIWDNGTREDAYCFKIIFRFHGETYRNRYTQLPFDVVSMFPCGEDEPENRL